MQGRVLLTEAEVAATLGISKVSVHRLRARRQLGWHKVGGLVRVSTVDLEAYLTRTRINPIEGKSQ
jgi:excisionase family DNA binding protein